MPGDIGEEGSCQWLVADAVCGLGGLDTLVSNPARQHAAWSVLDITTENFDWTFKDHPRTLDYACTMGAIMIWTKGPATQLAAQGIRVNGVAPGLIWTPLQPSGGHFTDDLGQFGSNTPKKRPGQPAELATVYVLLASNDSSCASGQVYGAEGGKSWP